jgi:hypothetical protein
MGEVAAAAAIVGAGIQIYGQITANNDQAAAEEENAAYYAEQAEFARQATVRELSLYNIESEDFLGRQKTQIAKGGVNLTGSALLVLGETMMRQMEERKAIISDGKAKEREALLRAGASSEQAGRLTSFSNNVLPAIGTTLTTAASVGTSLGKAS